MLQCLNRINYILSLKMSDDSRFDFMPLVGEYLAYRVDPSRYKPPFTWSSIRYVSGISEETFDHLFPFVQPIIDDYVESGAQATTYPRLNDLAKQTAHRITETYATIAPPGEPIDPGSASDFESTPYSDLPVLLMYYLGLIETAVYYLGQEYLYYAPNEWRALIHAGLNLCEYNGDYPYLYYLIKSVYLIHPSAMIRSLNWVHLPSVLQPQPLPPYTSQDLIDALSTTSRRGECTLTEKDLRNLWNAYQEAEEKYQSEIEENNRYRRQLEEAIRQMPTYYANPEQITMKRQSASKHHLLLDAINQALSIIERLTRTQAISGALSELGPFSRFPGGEQYRLGHEAGRAEFESYGGSGIDIDIDRRLQAIRSNSDATWSQLIPIAVDLGILSSDDPHNLQALLVKEADQLIAEIPSARPSRIAQIADMFALDQPIDRDALLDYLEQWRENIQTVTDWPTLLQSATALSIFTLPYERRAFRDFLLDFASQL